MLQVWAHSNHESLELPIPIDRFINEHLDIPVHYAQLDALPGVIPLAMTNQPSKDEPCRITVNESLLDTLFAETLGLERTTLAHEAGHCVFHIDHARSNQLELELPGLSIPEKHITTLATLNTKSLQDLRLIVPDEDTWWREWQAHTFMRYILMPHAFVRDVITDISVLNWPALYRLRDHFDVTISAVVVHLQTLGLIQVVNGQVIDKRRTQSLSPLL